jgi:hypothetical protein
MLLDINSNDLTNTSNVYYMTNNYPIGKEMQNFIIHKIQIPSSYYTVISKVIKIDSTTITLTDGAYNIADLCSMMQALIRTGMSDATFTVTYDSNAYSVTIAHTGANFTIDNRLVNGIGSFLGFSSTLLSGAITYTSTNSYNPYKDSVIGLCCDWLDKFSDKYNTSNIKSFVTWIPVKYVPDTVITYEPHYIIRYFSWLSLKSGFGSCNFWFVDQNGSVINFRNVPWFMTIEIN